MFRMKSQVPHYLELFLFISIQICLVDSACKLTPQVKFPDGKKERKQMKGLAVVNTTTETAINCFAKCSENCLCKSINVCEKTCQLNSGNQHDKSLSDSPDCNYYELSWQQQKQGVSTGCMQGRTCCSINNPCFNGGTCIEQCPTSSGKRYRCVCPHHLGVSGERCEIVPKSCRALHDINPIIQSGTYTLYDDLGRSFPAYCDFTLSDGKVWTLVQSFSLGNVSYFQKSPLTVDNPRNEENPESWEDYRLSKSKFSSIQKNTTHMRITCNYNIQPIDDMVDYVRFTNEIIDYLTYNADDVSAEERCIMTEYLNIRGGSCTDCTIALVQTALWNIFTNPSRNIVSNCDWKYPNGHASCEENFGGYECYSSAHRCTSSSTSTTQNWYGS